MKIGILTTYFADYGSYCHASCLYNYLIELGHDCELLNACVRYKASPKLFLANIGYHWLPKFILRYIAKKNIVFNNYMHLMKDLKNIKISESFRNISSLSKRYDCIVVGSDELWSITNKRQKYIPEYFGIGIECPIISYSTSGISLEHPEKNITEEMINGLKTFKHIAVRDPVTQHWVQEVLKKEIPIVLDPALLYPPNTITAKRDEKYILVYGEHFSSEQINKIFAYASFYDLPIISAVWEHEWCNNKIEITSMDILQQAFHNCTMCVTSTFHGSIFSILHKKNFTAFISPFRGGKVVCLLKSLGLENRINEYDPLHCMENTINWDEVEEKLNNMRIFSKNYLTNALNEIEKGMK